MAKQCSFDVVSEIDLQEVDNAVNQSKKEIHLRYDFKGSKSSFEFDRNTKKITILADDAMKLRAMQEILKTKAAKRGLSVKALKFLPEESAFGESLRQVVELAVGISKEDAKKIVKDIKTDGYKVQVAIQGEEIRVTGKKIDELQDVISFLKKKDYPFPVQFTNYRN